MLNTSMKECPHCKFIKEDSEFGFVKDRQNLRSWCKVCVAAGRMRTYYKSKDKARAYKRKRYAVFAAIIQENRKPCVCCGEKEPSCIDFHHEDPTKKKFNMNVAVNRGLRLLLLELAKCICLCANCHRKFHARKLELPA